MQADIVVISTSAAEGECYIETADLDGETNLKKRHACKQTRDLRDLTQLSKFTGHVVGEIPNSKLERYQGTLFLGEKGRTLKKAPHPPNTHIHKRKYLSDLPLARILGSMCEAFCVA